LAQEGRHSVPLFAVLRQMPNHTHLHAAFSPVSRQLFAPAASFVFLSHMAAHVADGAELPGVRVRSTNGVILELVEEGRARSSTFRALVEAIEQSNGIVYMEFGHCAFGHLNGCLLPFIVSTPTDRYVRIVVTPDTRRVSRDQLLALIGHELRHALEVLEHPDVVDLVTMDAMYRHLGTPIAGVQRGFETSAARAAGDAVSSELSRNPRLAQDGRQIGPPSITVVAYNQAAVDPETLARAKSDVTRIYGEVGIGVTWMDSGAADGPRPCVCDSTVTSAAPSQPVRLDHGHGDR
jgi:hypothetical protein